MNTRTILVCSSLLLVLLVLVGCDSNSSPPPDPRPSKAEILAEYGEAAQAQIAHIRACIELALQREITPQDMVVDLPVSLPVDDIVVRDDGESPRNARIVTMQQLRSADRVLDDLWSRFYNQLDTQRWADLAVDYLAVSDLRRAFEALQEENPSGEASQSYEDTLRELVELRYFILLREVGYRAPVTVDADTFTTGAFTGEILVFDVATETLIGLLPVGAMSSEQVEGSLNDDLRYNVGRNTRSSLTEAMGNLTEAPVIFEPPTPHEIGVNACNNNHDADACYQAGIEFWNGDGVEESHEQAAAYYSRACELGNADGCTLVGMLYRDGEIFEQDEVRARQLFDGSCQQGSMLACKELGILYMTGRGGETDFDAAFAVIERACTGGEQNGCMLLGFLYENGLGVSAVDFARARSLYEGACNNGIARACENLEAMGQ